VPVTVRSTGVWLMLKRSEGTLWRVALVLYSKIGCRDATTSPSWEYNLKRNAARTTRDPSGAQR
jgi:hypothetical protein